MTLLFYLNVYQKGMKYIEKCVFSFPVKDRKFNSPDVNFKVTNTYIEG